MTFFKEFNGISLTSWKQIIWWCTLDYSFWIFRTRRTHIAYWRGNTIFFKFWAKKLLWMILRRKYFRYPPLSRALFLITIFHILKIKLVYFPINNVWLRLAWSSYRRWRNQWIHCISLNSLTPISFCCHIFSTLILKSIKYYATKKKNI